ncbi:MAG TPA: peptidoglycan-binding protein, partial [Agromyces sp.]
MESGRSRRFAAALAWVAVATLGLAACSGDVSDVDRAKARVAAKQQALTQAEVAYADASAEFCDASSDYIAALDRYGDVIDSTAPTVGDVRAAGTDLAAPRDDAFSGGEAATAAQHDLVTAQQELADAQEALAFVEGGSVGEPSAEATPTSTPAVAAATVDRVKQADADFADAQASITDETPLSEASERFNSAVVALETAWLALYT